MRHDRDPLAVADAQRVEPGGLGPGPARPPRVRQLAPRLGGLVGLVDDRDPVAVDELGAPDEVVDSQRNLHAGNSTHAP